MTPSSAGQRARQTASAILSEVKKAMVGKDEVVIKVLSVILAGGHILLEDIPGVGKTTLALAFSRALALDYKRVQFTPDVMPSDITGFSVYNQATGALDYKKGAAMCNLLLADEINRAPSRTQAALLEVMEEGRVTVDGISHAVPKPFFVIATQNPTGSSGAQLLPDSQLDRFMARLSIGCPAPGDELEMLRSRRGGQPNPIDTVRPAADIPDLEAMQGQVDQVFLHDELYQYLIRLVGATRNHRHIAQGASPRASLAVMRLSQSTAWLCGRDYVLPEDVRAIFPGCIGHRLILSPQAKLEGVGADALLEELLHKTPAPRIVRGGRPC